MRGMAGEYAAGNSRGPGWCEFSETLGRLQAGLQAGSGMTRNRARARVNWVSQGQRWGRCKVRRRAERVSRPARAKTRRLRVLVVVVRSPRPSRAVQRARLCAITCTASQATFGKLRTGGETARRHVVQPDAVLEVAYGVLNLGVAAVVGLQSQHLPIAVGDEGVIAVSGEGGELGTGRRLHLPDNEPHRRGVRLGLERGAEPVSEVEGHNDIRRMGALEDRMVLPTSNLSQMATVVRTIFVSPNTSETGSASSLGDIGGAVHPVGNGRGRHLRVSPR